MDELRDCLNAIGELYGKAVSQTINQSRHPVEHGFARHDDQRKWLLFRAVYSSILYTFFNLILIVILCLEFISGYLIAKDKSVFYLSLFTYILFIILVSIFICFFNKHFSKNELVKYSLYLFVLISILAVCGLEILGFLLHENISLKDGQLYFDYNIFTLKNIIICISFCIICFLLIFRFNFSYFVNKMSNLSFIYFYNDNMDKIYIYEKKGDSYLCGYKDYIKCDKDCAKNFIKKMDSFYNKLKIKFKDNNIYLYSFKRDIEKTKKYAGYIKIDDYSIANFVKKMELYCDIEQKNFVPENLFVDLYEIIKTLEHLTAIFLVDEKDVKEVYPVCNDIQKSYFNF